jgi:hypothetical protein
MNLVKAGKKQNNTKSGAAAAHLKAKRDEAKLRQEAHSHLTLAERLTLAKSRPGESKREISKIEKAMKSEGESVKPEKAVKEKKHNAAHHTTQAD